MTRDRKEYFKEYRIKNKDRMAAYREANKERIAGMKTDWWMKNQERLKIEKSVYRIINRERIAKKNSEYSKNKKRTDLKYKLKIRLRHRIYLAIKGNAKTGSAVRDLGCSIDSFKEHISSKFLDGMSWENWGLGLDKWHLDHIKPLDSFDLADREQFLMACHYTNMQPLWHKDNLLKSNKVM